MKIKRLNRVITLLLTTVALVVGQNAWAASTFTVTNTSGTSKFVITRTTLRSPGSGRFQTGLLRPQHYLRLHLPAFSQLCKQERH